MKLGLQSFVLSLLSAFCFSTFGCGGSDPGMIVPETTTPLPPEDAPAGQPPVGSSSAAAPPAPTLPQ